MSNAVRWTIEVSPDTDLSLRAYLGARGMRARDLSKFVEEAVRWRMFDRAVEEARERFADLPSEELEAAIDETVREVRAEDR